MHKATDKIMDDNAGVWTANPGVARAAATFKTKIATEDGLINKQKPDRKGIAKDKDATIAKLIKALLPIAKAIEAWANEQGNGELATKMHFVPSKLKTEGDQGLKADAQNVSDAITANPKAMTDGGITQEQIMEFNRLVGTFIASIPAPRAGIAANKEVTDEVETALDDTDHFLKEVLDLRMEVFARTNPDFLGAYKNARIIVNFGGRSRKKKNNPTPPPAA